MAAFNGENPSSSGSSMSQPASMATSMTLSATAASGSSLSYAPAISTIVGASKPRPSVKWQPLASVVRNPSGLVGSARALPAARAATKTAPMTWPAYRIRSGISPPLPMGGWQHTSGGAAGPIGFTCRLAICEEFQMSQTRDDGPFAARHDGGDLGAKLAVLTPQPTQVLVICSLPALPHVARPGLQHLLGPRRRDRR